LGQSPTNPPRERSTPPVSRDPAVQRSSPCKRCAFDFLLYTTIGPEQLGLHTIGRARPSNDHPWHWQRCQMGHWAGGSNFIHWSSFVLVLIFQKKPKNLHFRSDMSASCWPTVRCPFLGRREKIEREKKTPGWNLLHRSTIGAHWRVWPRCTVQYICQMWRHENLLT
jgi:hypothetical protein